MVLMESAHSLDRTRLTCSGTYYEHRNSAESDEWSIISKLDTTGLKTQYIYSDNNLIVTNIDIAERRRLGHDIGRRYLSDSATVYHFDTDMENNLGEHEYTVEYAEGNDEPVLVDKDTRKDVKTTIDFTPAILAVAPYSEIGRSLYGKYEMDFALGSLDAWTCDFWIKYIWVENQILWKIGSRKDYFFLLISGAEPNYNNFTGDAAEDNVPYNAEVTETDTLVYNVALGEGARLAHVSNGRTEYCWLRDIGKNLENDTWVHFAVARSGSELKVMCSLFDESITAEAGAKDDKDVFITFNEKMNGQFFSFCLDEIYIDKSHYETEAEFKEGSESKIPLGSLDYRKKHFVLDADLEDCIVHSNIIDGLLESERFKEAVKKIISE